ncbi:DsbA family protein [Desulfohalovibrio reitneri]|uniref:DsbA family protein n=1 Tax=Desulfohalovibrio reitneri TaxID=1307759 RepID=UPI0009DCA1A0|nr:DsbA family protein [Desulfohalovibrio reitneri]
MYRVFIVCIALLLPITARADDSGLRQELRKLLKENPEIVLDVLRDHSIEVLEIVEQGVDDRKAAKKRERMENELENPLEPTINTERPIRGPEDAETTLVAYSDFLCPYCSEAAATVDEFLAEHPDSVRFQFKHMPRSSFSLELAKHFEAIALQDEEEAWRFHDLIFANQDELENKKDVALATILAELDIDNERLAKDLKKPKLIEFIRSDATEGNSFGFRGTPSFVLGGVSIQGAQSLEHFEKVHGLLHGEEGASIGQVEGEECIDCLEE